MFWLKPPYVIKIATVLLSVAFVVTANDAQTVTISDTNLGNEQETEKRELLAQVKQRQEMRSTTQLVAQRQQRLALVIGNGAYQEDPLENPVNDATDVAGVLRELDFEVILLTDLNWQSMDEAIENFSRQLHQGAVGVFYYAGHGVQVDGENYLIPIDAQLKRERDTRREAVPLGDVLRFMEEAESQVNIVIIDACRNNPFYREWNSTRGSSPVRGLSKVEEPAEGTIVAFATAPGQFAEDGAGQRNSPFTSNLLEYINTPNLEVADMFRQVRAAVLQETDSQQRPWYRESLIGSFFFKPTGEQLTPQFPSPPTASTPTSTQASCIVRLAVPASNARLPQQKLDNGKVEVRWLFGWRACPEATRYHLFVIGPNALNPIINERTITSATYEHRRSHYGVTQREGWTWKVRAFVDGQWGDWSEERKFNVALPD